jgi:hypothetical protein
MIDISELNNALRALNAADYNFAEAKEAIKELQNTYSLIEDCLAEIGVHHKIDVYLGEYGDGGRSLVLEDIDNGWDSYKAGEWISSSSTC